MNSHRLENDYNRQREVADMFLTIQMRTSRQHGYLSKTKFFVQQKVIIAILKQKSVSKNNRICCSHEFLLKPMLMMRTFESTSSNKITSIAPIERRRRRRQCHKMERRNAINLASKRP